ncbi:hypothetical protein [Streptomyces sp. HD]|uniref:hypothetical protein n=1 Tax=Streptomyces sp. HD TaxID=3020892 RepID=UPI00232BA73E|nr:hypothetical protein [Streptomyces sp. HD]MDC0765830.1 hypothetical protein [Streptomyces sp. HD]
MLRHEFQPGRLIAGTFLTLAGIIYAGDAGGAWETPWFAVIPLLVVGLFLAGTAAAITRGIRKRHRSASKHTPANPTTPTNRS